MAEFDLELLKQATKDFVGESMSFITRLNSSSCFGRSNSKREKLVASLKMASSS